MSELWPMDARTNLERGPTQPLRSFKCLLLMPFEDRLDRVAALIKSTVIEVFDRFRNFGFGELRRIHRLDWITSSGWPRGTLPECAWAASAKKNCFLKG